MTHVGGVGTGVAVSTDPHDAFAAVCRIAGNPTITPQAKSTTTIPTVITYSSVSCAHSLCKILLQNCFVNHFIFTGAMPSPDASGRRHRNKGGVGQAPWVLVDATARRWAHV
jgi:hypothetical protein